MLGQARFRSRPGDGGESDDFYNHCDEQGIEEGDYWFFINAEYAPSSRSKAYKAALELIDSLNPQVVKA